MNVSPEFLPLNLIRVDPELVPEALEVKGIASVDEEMVRGYQAVQHDFHFTDFIRVWKTDGNYLLIANYPCFKAHQKFYSDNPGQKVGCLVLSGATRVEIREYTSRMYELMSGNHSMHCKRLLSLKTLLLANPSLTYEDIKRIRGVIGVAQSEKGKMVERDYKLASSDCFFCGIIGISDLSMRPLRPDPDKALYPYGFCANRLLPILGMNAKATALFHEKYQDYLKEVQIRPHPEDFDHKPIYQWSGLWNQEEVVLIAEAAVRADGHMPIARHEDRDLEWKIGTTPTHDVKIPAFTFNQRRIDLVNIKRLVEFTYKSEIMYYSARSHLDRIRPVEHGESKRVKSADNDPGYESPMNNSEFDSPYFEWVRKNLVLYYCVRRRLLRSISLRAEHFGFPDDQPGSLSTYQSALEVFNDWFNTEFVGKKVFRYSTGRPEDHGQYPVYSAIRNYLGIRASAQENEPIKFKNFINETFSFVFKQLDQAEEEKRAHTKSLSDYFGDITQDELGHLVQKLIEKRQSAGFGDVEEYVVNEDQFH